MYVLGLGGSNHGFSSCLVKDGQVVCMIDDERITRKKYGVGLGIELAKGFSRNCCLDYAGIDLDDVDAIVGNDILSPTMYFRLEDRIKLINHHLAHAYSVFFPSGFDEAAILILDGVGSKFLIDGEWNYESMTLAYARGKDFTVLQKQYGKNIEGSDYVENSLGIFYALITDIIGFGEHEEGKTMGLAPYGSDAFYKKINSHISYSGKGQVVLTGKNIQELLQIKEDVNKEKDALKKMEICADIAWAGQKILEDIVMDIARHLQELTQCKNLCISGGVALNSVANYKIYKMNLYKDIFIQPAAGDNGTALGSALYGTYFPNNMCK